MQSQLAIRLRWLEADAHTALGNSDDMLGALVECSRLSALKWVVPKKQLIRGVPSYAAVRVRLGEAYLAIGDNRAALDTFDGVLGAWTRFVGVTANMRNAAQRQTRVYVSRSALLADAAKPCIAGGNSKTLKKLWGCDVAVSD